MTENWKPQFSATIDLESKHHINCATPLNGAINITLHCISTLNHNEG